MIEGKNKGIHNQIKTDRLKVKTKEYIRNKDGYREEKTRKYIKKIMTDRVKGKQ